MSVQIRRYATIFLMALFVASIFFFHNGQPSYAQGGPTEVGGPLFTTTTWQQVNSPYIITTTVVLTQGASLLIEPGVVVILAVTPSFPLDFVPVGQFGAFSTPTCVAKSELISARCLVNTYVVPLLSDRTTTLTGWSGSETPSFVAAIAGSFHFVILPKKMPT